MKEKVDEAGTNLTEDYATFEKTLVLQQPFYYGTRMLLICDGNLRPFNKNGFMEMDIIMEVQIKILFL